MDTESLKVVKEKCDTNNTIQLKKETVVYLEKIYKNFRSSQAARIVEKLKILSCPYCNQNGLITYKKMVNVNLQVNWIISIIKVSILN